MTWLYGFELEGFYEKHSGEISTPPIEYPTDGFPGLVEIKSSGGKDLVPAYFELLSEYVKYKNVSYKICEHTFSGKEQNILRQRMNYKDRVNIQNIYGKSPRLKGNKTLASFQINISSGYYNKDGIFYSRLFDPVRIVKNLDEEFSKEIKNSKRQSGFYAIKDNCRLEYRSLPNFVFEDYLPAVPDLLSRIEKCVEE